MTPQLTYYNDQELPVLTLDWSNAGEDFSTGWTFTVRVARQTARTTTVLLKTTGITSTATTVTIAWSTTDWSGLEASATGTDYFVYVYARRVSDSKDMEFRPEAPITLRLKAAPGTSAVSPSSYPITVTAASVTLADTGGNFTATNVEDALAEHVTDTVDAHDASAISVLDSADYFTGSNVETALAELAGTWKHKQTRSFVRNLANSNRPVNVLCMADSTSNETTEWFYLTMSSLLASYPAVTVHYRLWDDTAQGWGALSVLQTGTAGEAYLATDGTNNRIFSVVDNATISPTGDISVRVKFQPTGSWIAGSDSEIFNKFGAAGQRSWRFYLRGSDGKLVMEHSNDGTTLKANTSSVAVGFSSGQAGWIRADLDIDNGASQYATTFYTSTDGTNWTQLGTTVTGAGASASIFDSTTDINLGSRGGSGIAVAGKLYAADLYSGIGANPTLLAAWRPGELYWTGTSDVNSGLDVCGNTWTANSLAKDNVTGARVVGLLNASVSGQVLSYFTDATRFAKLAGSRCRMVHISLSHNEGGTYNSGDAYRSVFSGLVDQILAVQPDAAVVVHGQNPKASPSTTDAIRRHADRIRQLAELAATRDLGWVDAYAAMLGSEATYVGADGIHPTTAGTTLWTALTKRFLLNA